MLYSLDTEQKFQSTENTPIFTYLMNVPFYLQFLQGSFVMMRNYTSLETVDRTLLSHFRVGLYLTLE